MSMFNSIKRFFRGSADENVAVPVPPRPTPLSERKKKGMDIGSEKHEADLEAARRDALTNKSSADPYSTAAWEIDPDSGRRRLRKIDPVNANKKKQPNNPYDTSSDLNPWKRG